ncbi:MAG TPA: hypothetical protein VKU87_05970 [Thermomicrobiaceae bacterium]|nr:hypothetical protein [Thermomicrobiaceae bacterium]
MNVMVPLLALTAHTGARLAEIGFLLVAIAGVWIFAGEVVASRWSRFRLSVAGILLAAAGVLLIIATH